MAESIVCPSIRPEGGPPSPQAGSRGLVVDGQQRACVLETDVCALWCGSLRVRRVIERDCGWRAYGRMQTSYHWDFGPWR